MYVRRVVLTDVKSFSDLEFTFESEAGQNPGWYVITGENGTGKTVLLKTIAMAILGPDVVRTLQPSLDGWIRMGCSEARVAVQIVSEEQDRFTTGRPYKEPFWSEFALEGGHGLETTLEPTNYRRGKKKGPLNGPWALNTPGWFAAGYGPFRRLYGASSEAQRLMSGPERVARFATLFKEDATLQECEYWLKDLNYKGLEKNETARAILRDTLELLNDDFLQNGIKVDRVDSEGLWLEDANGAVLRLADMSEGYRAALAMMADLLRHLVEVFPDTPLVQRRDDGRLFVPHHGIVLIDEIDAHLHPEWQRKIGFWLTARFPHLQFIVTTHSPLVAQAARPGAIFRLPPPTSNEVPHRLDEVAYMQVLASKADVVLLSPAFGLTNTRSPEAVERRRRFARLATKQRTVGLSEEEQKEWRQLELFVHQDPDFAEDLD